jgi:hypothetical protein
MIQCLGRGVSRRIVSSIHLISSHSISSHLTLPWSHRYLVIFLDHLLPLVRFQLTICPTAMPSAPPSSPKTSSVKTPTSSSLDRQMRMDITSRRGRSTVCRGMRGLVRCLGLVSLSPSMFFYVFVCLLFFSIFLDAFLFLYGFTGALSGTASGIDVLRSRMWI